MNIINIGIIGAGPNATGHARYFAKSKRARLVAVADVDLPKARSLATECGDARSIADYRDFLPDVDAVIISSPNFLHGEHAVTCARAGKHVYIEKPMGLTVEAARDIVEAVEKAGVKSVVGYAVRFDPTLQTMARVVREGACGKLQSIASRRLVRIETPTGGWRADPELSGGLLMEINIHEIDWMLSLGGEVRSVYARSWASQKSGHVNANDHLWITLNFADDLTGQHEGSWQSPIAQFFRSVSGTAGGLSTDEWGGTLYHWTPGKDRETLALDPAFDLRGHFLDCITEASAAVSDVHWGMKVTKVCTAILKSASTGQVVPVEA